MRHQQAVARPNVALLLVQVAQPRGGHHAVVDKPLPQLCGDAVQEGVHGLDGLWNRGRPEVSLNDGEYVVCKPLAWIQVRTSEALHGAEVVGLLSAAAVQHLKTRVHEQVVVRCAGVLDVLVRRYVLVDVLRKAPSGLPSESLDTENM